MSSFLLTAMPSLNALTCATSWLCVEVAFWFYNRFYLYPLLNAPMRPAPNMRGPRGTLDMIFRQLEMLHGHYPMERFMRGWHNGAHLEDIRQLNIKESWAWVVYSSRLEDLSESQSLVMDTAVSEISTTRPQNQSPSHVI